jgi:hypothetical protein
MKTLGLLALLISLALTPALAQEDCADPPEEIDYEEVTMEISPCDGPVQQLVIQKTTVEGLTFEPTATVRVITLIKHDDTYEIYPTVFSEEQAGIYAETEVGDTLILGRKAE